MSEHETLVWFPEDLPLSVQYFNFKNLNAHTYTSAVYILDTIGHKKGWHTDIICFKVKVILSRDISRGWLYSSTSPQSTNSRDVVIKLLASIAVKKNSGEESNFSERPSTWTHFLCLNPGNPR